MSEKFWSIHKGRRSVLSPGYKEERAAAANRLGGQSVGVFNGELMVTRKVVFGTDNDTRYVSDRSMKGIGKI